MVPVAPIAAGPAFAHGEGLGLASSPVPSRLDPSIAMAMSGANEPGAALYDFEPAPKGLALPKEVEMLLSLVCSLRKVLLDLHLGLGDGTEAVGVGMVGSSTSHGALTASASDPSDVRNAGDLSGVLGGGRTNSAGGWAERDRLERSASSDRLGAGVSGGDLSRGGERRGSMGRSSSVNELAQAERANGLGRLASSEMAARRLVFLLGRLQLLLAMSTKESTKAFFYTSQGALLWTQRLMLRLWAYLISQVDAVTFRYQPAVFETLRLLMLRGELDCSALQEAPSSVLERYRKALWETVEYVVTKLNHKAAPTEVRVFCSMALATAFFRLPALRHTLLTTILPPGESRHKHVREWNLPWSLQKAALRECVYAPAPPSSSLARNASWLARPSDLTGDVSSGLQVGYLGASATAPQLETGSSSLAIRGHTAATGAVATAVGHAAGVATQLVADAAARLSHGSQRKARFPGDMGSSSPLAGSPQSSSASATAAQSAAATAAAVALPPPMSLGGAALRLAETSPLAAAEEERALSLEGGLELANSRSFDQWSQLWRARLNSATRDSERTLSGRYWRERLKKRGHCFFLLLEHWLQHTSMAMGLQPGEEVVWRDVPGAPTLIKAFLIEMKQRPLHLWPESMVSCLGTLLMENKPLLQVCVRILISRTSALHLRPSLAVLQHLDVVMRSIAPEPLPQTFSAEPLLRMLHQLADSEHFKVAASALIFLYNHLDAMGEATRIKSLEWLHGRFATFGLHWSRVVRTIYFHIGVIKVLHWNPPASPDRARRSSGDVRNLSVERQGSGDGLESILAREARGKKGVKNGVNGIASGGSGGSGSGDYGNHGCYYYGSAATANGGSSNGDSHHGGSHHGGSHHGGSHHGSGGSNGYGHGSMRSQSLGSRDSLHDWGIAHAESLSEMREVENLLEFQRVRDLYVDSFAALGKLAAAAAASTSPRTASGARVSPGRRSASPAANGVRFGGGRAGGAGRGGAAARHAGLGVRRGGGVAAVAAGGDGGAADAAGKEPMPPEAAERTVAEGAMAEAAAELGLLSPGSLPSASQRRTMGYAQHAWSEYEGVEKKWEAANEAMQLAQQEAAGAPSGAGGNGWHGANGHGGTQSAGSGGDGAPIRRSNSEPTLPRVPPNPLTLSLSMISAHVHDDDDDATTDYDEW